MKQTKSIEALNKLISEVRLGNDVSEAALLELRKTILKEEHRSEFKIKRIQKDKSLVVNLLDKAIEDLKSNVRKLSIANEEMQHFMHVASHDLKTPLRSIGSFANLINRKFSSSMPEDVGEYFSYIKENAKAMNGVIEDLVAFNKAGKNEVREPFDLSLLLDSLRSFLYADITENNVQLTYSQLGSITTNSSALGQLLQNFIRNAIVYSDQDRPCKIEVLRHDQGNVTTIAVRDNGIGLDEAFTDKIFLPFQRASVDREGTGMGLAICRKIARKLGGEIKYRGVVGVGTTFYVGINGEPFTDFAGPQESLVLAL